jgi:anti-sigma B factor antagonist
MTTAKGRPDLSEEFAISLTRAAGAVTVALHGEVDVLTVDKVRLALAEAVEQRPGSIVVDLAGLSFIDSTGLGALVFGFQRARDEGIAFRLAGPSPSVRQILVVSGLLEVVPVTD